MTDQPDLVWTLLASLLIYSIGEPLFDVSFTSLAFMLISGMLEESDAASA